MSAVDTIASYVQEINKECLILIQVGEVICDLITNGHPRDWDIVKQMSTSAIVNLWCHVISNDFQELCKPEKKQSFSLFSFLSRKPCNKFVGDKYRCSCGFTRYEHIDQLKKNGKHRCDHFIASHDGMYCTQCDFNMMDHSYNVSFATLPNDVKNFINSVNMSYTLRVSAMTEKFKSHPESTIYLAVIKANIDKFFETYQRVNTFIYVGGKPHMPY